MLRNAFVDREVDVAKVSHQIARVGDEAPEQRGCEDVVERGLHAFARNFGLRPVEWQAVLDTQEADILDVRRLIRRLEEGYRIVVGGGQGNIGGRESEERNVPLVRLRQRFR
jgi:hypothetical protein